MQDFRGARASVREALRNFRWFEYRPFAWIMAAELLFLYFASSLGTAWGMGVAGWVIRLSTGEAGVHYPTSFVVLPSAYWKVDSFVTAAGGSFLIPLALTRIQAPMNRLAATGPAALGRAWKAYLPTLLSVLANFALLRAWQELFPLGPSRWIHSFLPGTRGDFVSWCVGAIISCAVAAVFLYVPIRAVKPGISFRDSFLGGIQEGIRTLGPTLLIILVIIWPTFVFLAPVQLKPILLASKFRPELLAVLLGIATVLGSFVNYFVYSATARLHWLGKRREA